MLIYFYIYISLDGKQVSRARTPLRSRSAERCLQRTRGTGTGLVPGVKQSTLKLISMKPSTPPPPKPLFLVPKQPNPPSSPVPPNHNPSGTVSGLLYYDSNQEFEVYDDRDHKQQVEESEKDESESDVEQLDVECQVHRHRAMPSSFSNASLPTSGNTTTFK